MDKIKVVGGKPLTGTIAISGAKNAALPIMAACLLSEEELTLSNIPGLKDIQSMCELLEQHGVEVTQSGKSGKEGSKERSITFNAKQVNNVVAPYDFVRKMRASILVLGPLLARFGEAKVSLPGGCAIGTRPVDLHLKALEQLGAEIVLEDGYVNAKAPNGLKGAEIVFDIVSVGATENAIMAASIAEGTTIIHNAAKEPEITDLAKCLQEMGAKIVGAGTDTITIYGVKKLHKAKHSLIADRIEAGTYAVAAAITKGDLTLTNVSPQILTSVIAQLREIGVQVEEEQNSFRVIGKGNDINPTKINTSPYPSFPTDMQAQMMALLSTAGGTSHINETIFENRYMHVPELNRMGAKISVNDNLAVIEGTTELRGAEVMATDLRASVCLVLAALAADGETLINRVYHLDRGYEHLEEKLRACGANIMRVAS